MKWLFFISIIVLSICALGTNKAYRAKLVLRDTVPQGAPQLFGAKVYQFKNYVVVDSFLMIKAADTNNIPYWPAIKFKGSDRRWYGFDSTRWQRFLYATDTNSLHLSNSLLADSTGSRIQQIGDSTFILNTGVGGIYDSTVYAYPGDTLQRKLEQVPEYGRLMIMPGLHVLPLDTLNSIMYINRSNLTIEFAAGTHVKIKDSSNSIIDSVEINRNYYAITGLDDISAQTTIHPPIVPQSIVINISATGTPDQFTVSGASSGNGTYNMDGTFQTIGTTGIDVKFTATTGHTLNDKWTLITSSTPASILRVGQGFHTDYIKNTQIIGDGLLDGNSSKQYTVNGQAHESNYTVGVFGRTYNTTIKGLNIINSERSIMLAGRHSGTFNQDGSTTGGESFDVRNTQILDIKSVDNTSGFLFGHPAYRGYQKNTFMSGCIVISNTGLATVEPNHRCDSFIITNNYIENKINGSSIHLWRAPSNGKIFNNIIRGVTGDHAPSGWYRSFGLNNWADYDNNLFSLSQQNAISSTNNSSRIGLGTTTPTTKLQIVGPHVSGEGLLNVKGNSSLGFIVINTTTAPGTAGYTGKSGGSPVGSVQFFGSDVSTRVINDVYGRPGLSLWDNGGINLGVPNFKPTDVRLQVRDTLGSGVTNTIREVMKLTYKWSGTTPSPFPGLGVGLKFEATNALSNSTPKDVGNIGMKYAVGTDGFEYTDFVVNSLRNGIKTLQFIATGEGKVGIRTSVPAWALHVQGSIGQNKDSCTLLSGITSQDILLIDTSDTGRFKRIKFGSLAASIDSGIWKNNVVMDGDHTMNAGTNTWRINGTEASGNSFEVVNTTTGGAIYGSSDGSYGVQGNSNSLYGVYGTSSSNNAIRGWTTNGNTAGYLENTASSTNTVTPTLQLKRTTSGTAAAGIGSSVEFFIEKDNGADNTQSHTLRSILTDPANGNEDGQFELYGVNNATLARKFAVAPTGQWIWDNYGTGAFTGTPAYTLYSDASNNIIEGPVVQDSGIWKNNVTMNGSYTMTQGANNWTLTGSNANFSIKGINTSSGNGVIGQSASGGGVYGVSTSGAGLIGESSSGEALNAYILPSSTNALVPIARLQAFSTGTAANGHGGSLDWYTQSSGGSAQRSNRIGSIWTNATTGSRTSQLEIYGVNSTTEARIAALAGTGQWTWDGYGSGTFTGTPTNSLQTTSTGSIIEGPLVDRGTYTPTITDSSNVAAHTAYACKWSRIGDMVTVSGKIDIDPTASLTSTILAVTLPIASALTAEENLSGTGFCRDISGQGFELFADTANDRAVIKFVSSDAANNSFSFIFQYQIL